MSFVFIVLGYFLQHCEARQEQVYSHFLVFNQSDITLVYRETDHRIILLYQLSVFVLFFSFHYCTQ